MNLFLVVSIGCGLASIVNYFLSLSKLGVPDISKNADYSFSSIAIEHNKTRVIQRLFIGNSIFGSIFMVGVIEHYAISYTLLKASIGLFVFSYWIAAYTLGKSTHQIAGILVGVALITLTLVIGVSLLPIDLVLGVFTLIVFGAYILLIYFSIGEFGYKLNAVVEHRFSLILSLWIIIVCINMVYRSFSSL